MTPNSTPISRFPKFRRPCGLDESLSLVLAVLSVTSCRSDCDASVCAKVDQDALPGDIRVMLEPGTLVGVDLAGVHGLELTAGGEFVALMKDPYCWAVASNPCTLTLKRLQLRIRSFEVELTNNHTVHVEEPVLAMQTPLELKDTGHGYEIPANTKVFTNVRIDGQDDCAEATTLSTTTLNIDVPSQYASFNGTLPMSFHLTRQSCQQVDGQVSVFVGGLTPWAQYPQNQ
jgi:hypothetical protein